MGCGGSKEIGTPEEKERNAEINKLMRRERARLAQEVKLLLLGAGESGKSTIAKQMKIIHLEGFSDSEREGYKNIIFNNIVSSMRSIVEAAELMGVEVGPASAVESLNDDMWFTDDFEPEHAAIINDLWKNDGIQAVYDRRAEYQLNDSAAYYFDRVDAISAPDYVPSEDDVLRSRVKTTGIIETDFEVDKIHFKMVDVGGQRSERKKWMHCFQDVTAVIFCVAMSAYDQKLYEDDTTNRMHESLKLFEEICNNRWFTDTSMILFLNKKDLFADKIEKVSLQVCFPEYDGPQTYDAASEYIQTKFIERNVNRDKAIYPHETCATDTGNVRVVFNAVKDIILRRALDQTGFS